MHAQQTPSDLLEAQCRGIARALRIMKQTHFCVLLVKQGNTRMKALQLTCQINFLSLHKSEIWPAHAHKELVRRQHHLIGVVRLDITQTKQLMGI
jgi:hypothetical protein